MQESSSVSFALMEENDLEQISLLESQNFGSPWHYTDFEEALQKQNRIFLVAKVKEEVVGYCGLFPILDEGEITNVVIKESYRRNNIGSLMLQHLIELGKKRGVRSFTLEVRVGNEPAKRLYEVLGFKVEGIRKNFYENPTEDACIMWKR